MTGTTPYLTACEEMHLLIQADSDGELDAAGAAVLAAHVADCPGCAALARELGALSGNLRSALRVVPAPASLRATLAPPAAPRPPRPAWWRWEWRLAGGFATGAALTAAALLLWPPGGAPDDGVALELMSGHVRALQPGHLIDVASTDRHTVKPWFEGRIDFVPPVPDLSAEGYRLEGGRLDAVGGRTAAVLVYRRDRHAINVFIWPSEAMRDATLRRNGIELRQWHRDGLALAAVSDLEALELDRFVRRFSAD